MKKVNWKIKFATFLLLALAFPVFVFPHRRFSLSLRHVLDKYMESLEVEHFAVPQWGI